MTTTTEPSMRVTNIALDYNEMPREVTLIASAPVVERLNRLGFMFSSDEPRTLTIAAAAQVARRFGRIPSPDTVVSKIYNCLTGVVFNRFWYAGLDDYERQAGQ